MKRNIAASGPAPDVKACLGEVLLKALRQSRPVLARVGDENIPGTKALKDTDLTRVRGVPGVQWAVRLRVHDRFRVLRSTRAWQAR
jgi:hypothetical protein